MMMTMVEVGAGTLIHTLSAHIPGRWPTISPPPPPPQGLSLFLPDDQALARRAVRIGRKGILSHVVTIPIPPRSLLKQKAPPTPLPMWGSSQQAGRQTAAPDPVPSVPTIKNMSMENLAFEILSRFFCADSNKFSPISKLHPPPPNGAAGPPGFWASVVPTVRFQRNNVPPNQSQYSKTFIKTVVLPVTPISPPICRHICEGQYSAYTRILQPGKIGKIGELKPPYFIFLSF